MISQITKENILQEGISKNIKLSPPVIIIFIVVFTILVTSFCGYVLFTSQQQNYRQFVEGELENVNITTVNRVSIWRDERIKEAVSITYSPIFTEKAEQLIKSPNDTILKGKVVEELSAMQKIFPYQEIYLANEEFKIIASLNNLHNLIQEQTITNAITPDNRFNSVWIDFVSFSDSNSSHLGIYAPLVFERLKIIGSVIFIIDPSQDLYPLINTWNKAGDTGEVLLVEQDKDQVLFLNDLRFRSGTILGNRLPISLQSDPAVMAVQGTQGIYSGRDYRGSEVLAFLKSVPNSSWYIVSKIDQSEIFTRWNLRGAIIIGLFVGVFSILLIYAGFYYHRRQKQTYTTLFKTESKMRALIKHFAYLERYAKDGILLFDENDKLIQVNDSALEYYGYKREKIIGSKIDLFIDHNNLLAFQNLLKGAVDQDSFTIESVDKLKNGALLPTEITLRVLNIDGKNYKQMTVTDITELKVKNEEIRKLSDTFNERVAERTSQLENANKELDSFAYSISHDLRSPLRSIDGWSKVLAEDYKEKLGEKGFQVLNLIRSETRRMGQMIEDILRFSRETRSELELQDLDITAMVQNTVFRLQQANPTIKVQFVIQPGMKAKGDFRMLEIVFTNLLENSIKFTGKISNPKILVGEICKDNKRVFFVRDNGVGFDMAYVQKLFKVFQRLHKSSEFPGTGIGLATVHRIINRHGGKIWVEAQEDLGATFYFTLNKEG